MIANLRRHRNIWRGLGSPMLPLPVAATKARHQLPTSGNLSRAEVLQTLGLLFALRILSATGMIHQFYPGISEGDATIADLARNIGFGGGVFGFSLVLLTRFYQGLRPRGAVAWLADSAVRRVAFRFA